MFRDLALVALFLFCSLHSCQSFTGKAEGLVKDSGEASKDAMNSNPDPQATDVPNEKIVYSDEMLCVKIREEWRIFVEKEQIQACKAGDPCVKFGSYGNCDCNHGIASGRLRGFALNRKYLEKAQNLETLYYKYCGKRCFLDLFPGELVGCVDGVCTMRHPDHKCR